MSFCMQLEKLVLGLLREAWRGEEESPAQPEGGLEGKILVLENNGEHTSTVNMLKC